MAILAKFLYSDTCSGHRTITYYPPNALTSTINASSIIHFGAVTQSLEHTYATFSFEDGKISKSSLSEKITRLFLHGLLLYNSPIASSP